MYLIHRCLLPICVRLWRICSKSYIACRSHLSSITRRKGATSLTTLGGVISFLVLTLFCGVMVTHLSCSSLPAISNPANPFLPQGLAGAAQAIPYALFMFLGVEQAANAAGDMHAPMKNLPKALFLAVGTVLLIGLSVLLFSSAGDITAVAAADGNPLYVAITKIGAGEHHPWLTSAIGIGSIIALLSTVFSLIYASSRQIFSLALGGLLLNAILTFVETRLVNWIRRKGRRGVMFARSS